MSQQQQRRGRFDIESDGLLDTITKVHVLTVKVNDEATRMFVGPAIRKGLALLDTCDVVVAHNGIAFDLPALWKLYRWKPKATVEDTLTLSCLLFPDIDGHGLAAWGERLGAPKLEYTADYVAWRLSLDPDYSYRDGDEWLEYNDVMGRYCVGDTETLAVLDNHLLKAREGWDWSQAVRMEHQFAKDFAVQGIRGVMVDRELAEKLLAEIDAEMSAIAAEVEPMLPARPGTKVQLASSTPPKLCFCKDGSLAKKTVEWFDSVEQRDDGWYGKKYGVYHLLPTPMGEDGERLPIRTEFTATLANQQHIKTWLMDMGWQPTMWSFKKKKDSRGKLRYVRGDDGNLIPTWPKFHEKGELCKNLEEINSEFPHVKACVRWIVIRHRRGLIRSIVNAIRPDGTVSATGFALGTPTSRVTHSVVANIPKADDGVVLGKECRSIFMARPGRKLVGVDASGLELRCLAHYVASAELSDIIVNGTKENGREIHTVLWKACSKYVQSRSIQKNVTYCVPMDTRALTREGWKTRDQLRIGELVLTYNQEKNVKEWKPILALHDTEGEVFRLRHNHHFDVRATADHRWYVRQRTGKSTRYMVDEVRTTEGLTTESNIITNAPMVPDAEGQVDWAGIKYGRDWVGEVLGMSSQQRKAFLAGFLIADGHVNEDGRWQFTQLRNEHYEAALMAAYLEHDGYISVRSSQQSNGKERMDVLLQKKQHVTGQKLTKSSEGVHPVWCMTTENGSWVMRQGDVITITGNCWLYGGSDKKLGQTAGHPDGKAEKIGKEIRSRMIASVPGLDALMKKIDRASKVGYIRAIDGRRIEIRSKHATLNTLLQSCGSILVKMAQCYMNAQIRKQRLDAWQVISYHDEIQLDSHPLHAERAGQLFVDGLQWAGNHVGFRVPLTGEIKVGNNWADTH